MALPARRLEQVRPAAQLPTWYVGAPRWSFASLAGRFIEISGARAPATLTMAMGLVRDAQRLGEPVAWITPAAHCFHPPDAAAAGVDLAALVVVRTPSLADVAPAADRLLRSGAFGLVVSDLWTWGTRGAEVAMALQSRLVGLAQKHDAVACCLTATPAEAPSLGSLVSLRAVAARTRIGRDRFRCTVTAAKDKRRAPGWTDTEECRGPAGLC